MGTPIQLEPVATGLFIFIGIVLVSLSKEDSQQGNVVWSVVQVLLGLAFCITSQYF